MKDASELRIKETDRIKTIVENLRRLGVETEEFPDELEGTRAVRNSAPPNSILSAITASPWRSQ